MRHAPARHTHRTATGPWRRVTIWTVLAVSALAVGCVPEEPVTGPEDVNYWEQRKGSCEAILTTPHSYESPDVTRCMKLWETYKSIGDLSVDIRSMYAVAFSLAWYRADNKYDKLVAEAALARLCIPRHPLGPDGKIKEEVPTNLQCGAAQMASMGPGNSATDADEAPTDAVATTGPAITDLRASVKVGSVSEKRLKQAAGFNKKALKAMEKKAYGSAIDFYEQALELHPHYVLAQYNYICALALMGDDQAALGQLEKMYTWDDPEVNAKLIKAREDADLLALRDYPQFKQLTGYFRLTIANGAGEPGLEHVNRIVAELGTRRYTVHQLVENKQPRMTPEIWYKPGFEAFAQEFKVILGVRKVYIKPIDWDTLEDMIIVWGQPEAAAMYSTDSQMAPIVQGTRAEEEGGGLDALTGAVKDTQGSVEGAVDTGKGVGDAVPAE